MKLEDWKPWFAEAVTSCFRAASGGPVVFQQTDRLVDGLWVDKAMIVESARSSIRWRSKPPPTLTWHKIALRREPGRVDLHRPTYSHVLAYGGNPGRRTPDVLHTGRHDPDVKIWKDGIGRHTAMLIMAWLSEQGVTSVLNPFCGRGTLLAAANERGMDAFGCDLDAERVSDAKAITFTSSLFEPDI